MRQDSARHLGETAREARGGLRSVFHNFNLRIFNLRVSNPDKFIVDVFLTRCGISMCQSLGPKKHDEISEIGCISIIMIIMIVSSSSSGSSSITGSITITITIASIIIIYIHIYIYI